MLLSVFFVFGLSLLSEALPLVRMRLCIASSDPFRLQSQCVFCHNKRFPVTVRQCTGGTYLPANVTLNEAYCMVKQCRQQLPLIRPQPYTGGPGAITVSGGPPMTSALTSGNQMAAESVNSIDYGPADYTYQPAMKLQPNRIIRPPAPITVGRPVRPTFLTGRPSFLLGRQTFANLFKGFVGRNKLEPFRAIRNRFSESRKEHAKERFFEVPVNETVTSDQSVTLEKVNP